MPLKHEAGWYKDAVIYQIHVRTFNDSDGDGIADQYEGLADFDSDAVPNYLDADSDGRLAS